MEIKKKHLRLGHEDDGRATPFAVLRPDVQLVGRAGVQRVNAEIPRSDAGRIEHGLVIRLGLQDLQVEKLRQASIVSRQASDGQAIGSDVVHGAVVRRRRLSWI